MKILDGKLVSSIGVGPMTIAGLILNTYEAWKMKNFIE